MSTGEIVDLETLKERIGRAKLKIHEDKGAQEFIVLISIENDFVEDLISYSDNPKLEDKDIMISFNYTGDPIVIDRDALINEVITNKELRDRISVKI